MLRFLKSEKGTRNLWNAWRWFYDTQSQIKTQIKIKTTNASVRYSLPVDGPLRGNHNRLAPCLQIYCFITFLHNHEAKRGRFFKVFTKKIKATTRHVERNSRHVCHHRVFIDTKGTKYDKDSETVVNVGRSACFLFDCFVKNMEAAGLKPPRLVSLFTTLVF